jgi:hypothetical protein
MRIRTLLTAALLTALPLSGALAKDAALAKAVADEHRSPNLVERDKYRHPGRLEFAGIAGRDRGRDRAGRWLLTGNPGPVPEGQGHVLHSDGTARRERAGGQAGRRLEQETCRQQGALGQREDRRVR